jgi:hypothetical protein
MGRAVGMSVWFRPCPLGQLSARHPRHYMPLVGAGMDSSGSRAGVKASPPRLHPLRPPCLRRGSEPGVRGGGVRSRHRPISSGERRARAASIGRNAHLADRGAERTGARGSIDTRLTFDRSAVSLDSSALISYIQEVAHLRDPPVRSIPVGVGRARYVAVTRRQRSGWMALLYGRA